MRLNEGLVTKQSIYYLFSLDTVKI